MPASELLEPWLTTAIQVGASDVHLVAGYPPIMRLHGELQELAATPLAADELQPALEGLCTPGLLAKLPSERNIDFTFEFDGPVRGRFRANLFYSGHNLGGCLRVVPTKIPAFSWAEFPEGLADRIAQLSDGLVIVTGATGSGKTTTLAMLVNLLNQRGGYRIITVEEPIEYVFPKTALSLVTQREVGADVVTFADGLRSGLRQDPDIILVGEIRDRETAQMALSAAETGHLVLTTLHTRDAKGTITRFSDFFPQEVQKDVRVQLSMSLRTIVSQRLLPDVVRGEKRHLALEVLWNTVPVGSGIRSGKFDSLDNYLLTGRDDGMISFDESVRLLLKAGKISYHTAEQNVRDVAYLRRP